jgi:hypothetical protein
MKFITIVIFLVIAMLALTHAKLGKISSVKQVEAKVKQMDPHTKKRVLAMTASGMPKDAIAKSISYVAGNTGTAHKLIDGIHQEDAKSRKLANARKRN